MSSPKFSIVLPCYNEAGNIPLLLQRFRPFAKAWDFELILVNNGSVDNSMDVLTKAQKDVSSTFLRVVNIETNIGYGHGIQTGLEQAKGKILAYSHADIQTPPEDVFKAFGMITSGQVDLSKTLIKGFRINRSDDKTFLTRGLTQVVHMLLGTNLEDINGQPKVFQRAFFESFSKPPLDFSYDVFVLYWALLRGLTLHTFDVDFGERIHGQSKWDTGILLRYKSILEYFRSIFLISWRNRSVPQNPIRHFIRFLITGVFNNILNYGTFFTLLRFFQVNYILSSVIGFFAGFVLSFFVNRSLTFHENSGKMDLQMIKFLIVNLIALGVNVLTIYLFVDVFGIIAEISQIIAIGVSTLVNFSGSKFWAFRQTPEGSQISSS